MSQPNSVDIQVKVSKVFASCQNFEQLAVAKRYQRLARRAGVSSLSPDVRRQAKKIGAWRVRAAQATQQAISEMEHLQQTLASLETEHQESTQEHHSHAA